MGGDDASRGFACRPSWCSRRRCCPRSPVRPWRRLGVGVPAGGTMVVEARRGETARGPSGWTPTRAAFTPEPMPPLDRFSEPGRGGAGPASSCSVRHGRAERPPDGSEAACRGPHRAAALAQSSSPLRRCPRRRSSRSRSRSRSRRSSRSRSDEQAAASTSKGESSRRRRMASPIAGWKGCSRFGGGRCTIRRPRRRVALRRRGGRGHRRVLPEANRRRTRGRSRAPPPVAGRVAAR